MGFFKKIFKGIGKVFKKIGKGIKSAFKKVGKWMGKLGIFGQLAMAFIPGLNIFGSLFSKLGGRALSLLSKGLAGAGQKGLLGSIVKGASWMLDTPRKILGGITKGFKTVTSAATSFVSNTAKFIGQKMKLTTTGPTSFFGTGGDSVLGRVGTEVSNNFKAFQDTVAGTFSGVEGRAAALDKQLNVVRIGDAEITSSAIEDAQLKDDASYVKEFGGPSAVEDLYNEIELDVRKGLGKQIGDNFQSLKESFGPQGAGKFLETMQAKPGFVNEFIRSGPEEINKYFEFQKGAADATNPFAKSLDDTKFFSKENFIPDFSNLPKKAVETVALQGISNLAFPQGSIETPTRQAFNIQNVRTPSLLSMPGQSDVAGLSGSGAAYGLASSIDPYAFLSPIMSGINMDAMDQGSLASFGLPGPQSFQPRMTGNV